MVFHEHVVPICPAKKEIIYSHDLIYRQGMSVTCPRICSYERKCIVEKNKVIRK